MMQLAMYCNGVLDDAVPPVYWQLSPPWAPSPSPTTPWRCRGRTDTQLHISCSCARQHVPHPGSSSPSTAHSLHNSQSDVDSAPPVVAVPHIHLRQPGGKPPLTLEAAVVHVLSSLGLVDCSASSIADANALKTAAVTHAISGFENDLDATTPVGVPRASEVPAAPQLNMTLAGRFRSVSAGRVTG